MHIRFLWALFLWEKNPPSQGESYRFSFLVHYHLYLRKYFVKNTQRFGNLCKCCLLCRRSRNIMGTFRIRMKTKAASLLNTIVSSLAWENTWQQERWLRLRKVHKPDTIIDDIFFINISCLQISYMCIDCILVESIFRFLLFNFSPPHNQFFPTFVYAVCGMCGVSLSVCMWCLLYVYAHGYACVYMCVYVRSVCMHVCTCKCVCMHM